MSKVVVGLELDLHPEGMYLEGPLVLGIIAVFPSHSVRVPSIYALVELFAHFPIDPIPVPDEEGWDRIQDLSSSDWCELQGLLAKRWAEG